MAVVEFNSRVQWYWCATCEGLSGLPYGLMFTRPGICQGCYPRKIFCLLG